MTLSLLPMLCFAMLSDGGVTDLTAHEVAAPACHYNDAGTAVTCDTESFKTLTDMTLDARTASASCLLQKSDCEGDRAALQQLLSTKVMTPVVPEKPSALRPVLAMTGAVLSTMLVTSAPFWPVQDERWKWVGAAVGAVGLALSYVFVLPQ